MNVMLDDDGEEDDDDETDDEAQQRIDDMMNNEETKAVFNYYQIVGVKKFQCSLCNSVLTVARASQAFRNIAKHLMETHGLLQEYNKQLSTPASTKGSIVWDYFVIIGPETVACLTCGVSLSWRTGSTGSMRNHLRLKHGDLWMRAGGSLDGPGPTATPGRPRSKLGPKSRTSMDNTCKIIQMNHNVVQFVTKQLQPPDAVCSKEFQDLLKCIMFNYIPPSKGELITALRRQQKHSCELLTEELRHADWVSTSVDVWDGMAAVNTRFITTRVHWIDRDWKFQSHILGTREISSLLHPHEITQCLNKLLQAHGLSASKVSSVVVNSATCSNYLAMSLMSDTPMPSQSCFCHALESGISRGMDSVPEIVDVLDIIRNIVVSQILQTGNIVVSGKWTEKKKGRHVIKTEPVDSSESNKTSDTQCLPVFTLDEKNMWVSTYKLIQKFVQYENIIISRLRNCAHEIRVLEKDKWNILRQLESVLKPLKLASEALSRKTNIGISVIFPIVNGLLKHHLRDSDTDIECIQLFKYYLRSELVSKLNMEGVAVSNNAIFASLFDPRYKNLNFLNVETRQSVKCHVQTLIANLETDRRYEPRRDNTQFNESHRDSLQFLLTGCDIGGEEPDIRSPQVELDTYLTDPIIPAGGDGFQWWSQNGARFPAVAKLAKKYLCIPATCCEPNAVFLEEGSKRFHRRDCLDSVDVVMLTGISDVL